MDLNSLGPQGSDVKLEPTSNLHGGWEKYRATNEAIYNYKRLEKFNQLDYVDDNEFKQIKKRAEEQTEFLRERFKAMQQKHMSIPEGERIPHYIDKSGNVHPYSEEYLKQTKFYHENKLWHYNALKNRMDTSHPEYFNPYDEKFLAEMNSLRETPQDMLLLHPTDAVKDVTPAQYISQYKGQITFEKTSLKRDGKMHDYSRTYMDE